eukprot:3561037-Amphidinium_carterae.1
MAWSEQKSDSDCKSSSKLRTCASFSGHMEAGHVHKAHIFAAGSNITLDLMSKRHRQVPPIVCHFAKAALKHPGKSRIRVAKLTRVAPCSFFAKLARR